MKLLFRKYALIITLCASILCFCSCNTADNTAKSVRATVVEIEKYGHAVLDITTAEFIGNGFDLGDIVTVSFNSYQSDMPFYDGYYTNPGSVMLRGLSAEENIAVCINYGDFSKETGIKPGDTVEISLHEKAGMLAMQELCALTYSNDRADYSDDATFANFRAVTTGSIGDGKLYRSASPVNNRHGRAGYANDFIRSAGIATVLNLADSDEDIAEYFAKEDFESEYYRSLYESGKVLPLDLAGNFFTDEFAVSIAKGLTFLSENEAPYVIHCTEGKDRAGFTAMILEALMGAELQEIIDDYMLTYYNYYGIDKEATPERYEVVLSNNLIPILCHVTGADSLEELQQIDLESTVTEYLINHGMDENDIITLKEKLS